MLFDQFLQGGDVVLVLHSLEADRLLVDPLVEVPRFVQDVGHAAGHAGREVLAGGAEHHHRAAGHVLAAVVPHPFHHRGGPRVADAEPLARNARDKGPAAGGAVEGDVAGDDVFLRLIAGGLGRAEDDLAARQALAHVVVALADQLEGQALRDEGPEALAARAGAAHRVGVVGQGAAVAAGDLAAQDGAEGAVGVGHFQADRLGRGAGQLELLHQHPHIGGPLKVEVVTVFGLAVDVQIFNGGVVEDGLEVEFGGPAGGGAHPQQVGAAHQFVHGAHAELCHVFPQLLGHKGQVADDVLRPALEVFAQLGVLGADAHGAGVQVAHPHHDAALGHQQACAEAEFLRAQHAADRHVPPAEQLGVALDPHPGAQAVQDQGLVGLGDAQLPGQAGVLDGGAGGRAGAAVVARHQDDLRARLGDAGGDGAHPRLADQLDVDAGGAVGVFQVVDQLGQVLDGVDVVVGRGRDEPHAGGAVAGAGDPRVDLAAGQLAALAGLCALGQFDLDLLRRDEVLAGDAEPRRRHLLDPGVGGAAVALGRLAPFAGVAAGPDLVEGQGDGLVGLAAQGAVAHGRALEALENALHRFDLFQRDAAVFGVVERQQAAQVDAVFPHVVHRVGELLEGPVIALKAGFAEEVDGLGVEQVLFAPGAVLVRAGACQLHIDVEPQGVEGGAVPRLDVGLDVRKADAPHPADGAGEVAVDDLLRDAHRLEDLAALVALDGGDPHFGGDLDDAVQHGAVVVGDGGIKVLVQQAVRDQPADGLVGEVGVDGAGAVAQQGREVVDLPRLGALEDEGEGGGLLGADQVLAHRRHRQQAGDGDVVLVDAAVGQDDDVGPVLIGAVHLQKDPVDGLFQAGVLVIGDGDGGHLEAGDLHLPDLEQVGLGQDGVMDLQHLAVLGAVLQQVAVGADVDAGGGDHLLPYGVDGRVGHLGEHLLEVAEQGRAPAAQNGQRGVRPHRAAGLGPLLGHGQDDLMHLLVAVAEGLFQPCQLVGGVVGHLAVGDLEVFQFHQAAVQPLAVGLAPGVELLQLLVVHHLAPDGVHQQHLAGAQPVFDQDVLGWAIQHPHLGGKDHPPVLGDHITAGAQAVAVQHRPHHVPVRKEDGRRAVPGLQHGGVVLVEVPLFPGNILVVLPRLGDGDHDGEGQVHPVHHHELEGVVQHGRVGAGGVDDGQDLAHLLPHDGGSDGFLPGQHGVGVALDGVDLAVVQDEAVGVGPHPAGGGVGGKAAVHHPDGGLVVLVLQIGIEAAQLPHQEHPLVDDGAAGQAGHIAAAGRLLEHPPDDVEPPVEVDAPRHLGRLTDEALPDGGHAAAGGAAQNVGLDRHLAPGQEGKPLLAGDQLEQLHGAGALMLVLRKEEHPHPVLPLAAEGDVHLLGHFGEKGMADLQKDAHAVAGAALGVLAGAVLQMLDDGQRVADGLVAFAALDVHHRADAAGVVLKAGVVQAGRAFAQICHPYPILSVFHTLTPRWRRSLPARGPTGRPRCSRARPGWASRRPRWSAPGRSNISQTARGRAGSLW